MERPLTAWLSSSEPNVDRQRDRHHGSGAFPNPRTQRNAGERRKGVIRACPAFLHNAITDKAANAGTDSLWSPNFTLATKHHSSILSWTCLGIGSRSRDFPGLSVSSPMDAVDINVFMTGAPMYRYPIKKPHTLDPPYPRLVLLVNSSWVT